MTRLLTLPSILHFPEEHPCELRCTWFNLPYRFLLRCFTDMNWEERKRFPGRWRFVIGVALENRRVHKCKLEKTKRLMTGAVYILYLSVLLGTHFSVCETNWYWMTVQTHTRISSFRHFKARLVVKIKYLTNARLKQHICSDSGLTTGAKPCGWSAEAVHLQCPSNNPPWPTHHVKNVLLNTKSPRFLWTSFSQEDASWLLFWLLLASFHL